MENSVSVIVEVPDDEGIGSEEGVLQAIITSPEVGTLPVQRAGRY